MGNAKYNDRDWDHYTKSSYSGKTQDQVFRQRAIHADLDPSAVKLRESVDSPQNPESTPIILTSDVTGSMGVTADIMIREGLGKVFRELYDRKPVPDPHILCAATGDAYTDQAPLQVTQFEADGVVLSKQLENIWIEKNGGGNAGESYPLVWAFVAGKVHSDSFAKRGRKGYIFTVGDEAPHPEITADQFKRVFGIEDAKTTSSKQVLEVVRKTWNVFHLIVQPAYPEAITKWKELLGERAIELQSIDAIPQTIVACIEVCEGQDAVAGRTGAARAVAQNVTKQLQAQP